MRMPTVSFWAAADLFIIFCAALVARPGFSAVQVVVLSWAAGAVIFALFVLPGTAHVHCPLVVGLLCRAVATAALLVRLIASTSRSLRSSRAALQGSPP